MNGGRTAAGPGATYVVRGTVAHERTHPLPYSFEHRTTAWLVDAAAPNAAIPRWLRWWVQIRGRDHLTGQDTNLLTGLRSWLSDHGVGWSAAQARVLVGARTAGHVFNPLTTYFCFDADGALEGILAEVHNTYGGRHCYPLPADSSRPGPGGTSSPRNLAAGVSGQVDKELYVSPFFTVEGRYDIRARLSDNQVSVAITLTQHGRRVFSGSVHGRLCSATPRAVRNAVARDPFAAQRVSALIRWHGIRLWLRRLPVVPRRLEDSQRPAPPSTRDTASEKESITR